MIDIERHLIKCTTLAMHGRMLIVRKMNIEEMEK